MPMPGNYSLRHGERECAASESGHDRRERSPQHAVGKVRHVPIGELLRQFEPGEAEQARQTPPIEVLVPGVSGVADISRRHRSVDEPGDDACSGRATTSSSGCQCSEYTGREDVVVPSFEVAGIADTERGRRLEPLAEVAGKS